MHIARKRHNLERKGEELQRLLEENDKSGGKKIKGMSNTRLVWVLYYFESLDMVYMNACMFMYKHSSTREKCGC